MAWFDTAMTSNGAKSAQIWIILPTLGAIALVLFFTSGVAEGTGFNIVLWAFVVAIVGLFALVIRTIVRGEGKKPANPVHAPGWYPDPQDSRVIRWYDGAQWTSHTQSNY